MVQEEGGPWSSLTEARLFLNPLVGNGGVDTELFSRVDINGLENWLVHVGLGALAYKTYKDTWPELANHLRHDYFNTAVDNRVHFQQLEEIASLFAGEKIPFVMLKGAALSHTIYTDDVRPMSDLDLWVRRSDMDTCTSLLQHAGYRSAEKSERPLELQELSDGEWRFASPYNRLVELHWSPFSGWWIKRTAKIDTKALWRRTRSINLPRAAPEGQQPSDGRGNSQTARVLSSEDTILHLAVHLAINHQFGMWGVRSLVDITMVMQDERVDWQALVSRAYEHRLAIVLWQVLVLQQELIGSPDLGNVLRALEPSQWRARLLRSLIRPENILTSHDLRGSAKRFILLLLLTDRVRDAARLVLRTVFPEKVWLQARYGTEDAGYGRHLMHLLRHRTI